MTLEKINTLTPRDAVTLFRQCCGSLRWAQEMQARRPFGNLHEFFSVAEEVWYRLTSEDWKEAFSHHPKIGDIKEPQKKFAATAQWAEGEQAGVQQSSEKVLKALAEGNNYMKQNLVIFSSFAPPAKTRKKCSRF